MMDLREGIDIPREDVARIIKIYDDLDFITTVNITNNIK